MGGGWNLSFLLRASYGEQVLGDDADLVYTYLSLNSSDSPRAEVFVTVQISSAIHTPESLIHEHPLNAVQISTVLEDEEAQILSSPQIIIGRMLIYQGQQVEFLNQLTNWNTNLIQAILYWHHVVVFDFGNYLAYRKVQISVFDTTQSLAINGLIANETDFQGAQRFLQMFARAIAYYWTT